MPKVLGEYLTEIMRLELTNFWGDSRTKGWMNRKHLFCDGVRFEMRLARSIEKVSVLVVIGVAEDG